MMREILFRGKRLNNGEWVEGFFAEKKDPLLESDVRNAFILAQARGDFFATWFPVDPSTVGQYTGLTDKNGERIFEGDVVRATIKRSYGCQSPRTEKGVIGYDCIGMIGLILYRAKNGENVWSDFFNELSMSGLIEDYYFEVIGNIHDNTELLEGGEEE